MSFVLQICLGLFCVTGSCYFILSVFEKIAFIVSKKAISKTDLNLFKNIKF